MTMPENATPGNASTPNSRSALSRAAFNFGSSPGAPRAMRCTVGASASGSGSRICGRSVVSCDVAKSALTPTIVNSCSRLSLRQRQRIFQRHPFANRLGGRKQLLGERFGNHRDRRSHDAVLERDRPTSKQRRADRLEKIFADARDLRRDELRSVLARRLERAGSRSQSACPRPEQQSERRWPVGDCREPSGWRSRPLAPVRLAPADARPPVHRLESQTRPSAPGRASRR